MINQTSDKLMESAFEYDEGAEELKDENQAKSIKIKLIIGVILMAVLISAAIFLLKR